MKGKIEGIGAKPRARLCDARGKTLVREDLSEEGFDHAAATRTMMRIAAPRLEGRDISAVGRRVVHGGPDYSAPVLLNNEIIAKLATFIPLATLHQPRNLAVIRAIKASHPELPQLHVSTRLSTTVNRRWRKLSQSHENIHRSGSGGMVSTAFHMNMSRPGSENSLRNSRLFVSSSRTLETARAYVR